jgi:hypothetical protein
MTRPVEMSEGFAAFYVGANKKWRVARDARGEIILCETEALANSVARYRRRRLKIWS